MRATKRYSPKTTKKAIDTYTDPYLPSGGGHEIALCKKCHAIYQNKRWFLDEALYEAKKEDKVSMLILCPACQKIRDNFAEGYVTLRGTYLSDHKTDIMNLVRNEEERARIKNPLERIINLEDKGDVVEITTTNEKLAQRIGKKIHRACHGELHIKWTKNKLTRVSWKR